MPNGVGLTCRSHFSNKHLESIGETSNNATDSDNKKLVDSLGQALRGGSGLMALCPKTTQVDVVFEEKPSLSTEIAHLHLFLI